MSNAKTRRDGGYCYIMQWVFCKEWCTRYLWWLGQRNHCKKCKLPCKLMHWLVHVLQDNFNCSLEIKHCMHMNRIVQ